MDPVPDLDFDTRPILHDDGSTSVWTMGGYLPKEVVDAAQQRAVAQMTGVYVGCMIDLLLLGVQLRLVRFARATIWLVAHDNRSAVLPVSA